MKNAVRWVKDALATKDMVHHMTHYLIKGGMIHASDGRMVAAHPFDFDEDFLVPGEKFEKVLLAMPVDTPELVLKEGVLHVSHGRFKSRISTIAPDLWPMGLEFEGDFTPLAPGLLEAVARVRPFVSENATQQWATGVGLVPGFVYATNNVVIARAEVPDFDGNVLVPGWAADFILARREGITGYAVTSNSIVFQWEGGGWMKSVIINGTFPDKAGGMIDTAKPAKTAITPEWRATFNRLAALVDEDELHLGQTLMHGSSGDELQAEDEASTPTPKGEEASIWNPKFLQPVIDASTHWNPAAWPEPSRFKGEGIEGIILGRRGK